LSGHFIDSPQQFIGRISQIFDIKHLAERHSVVTTFSSLDFLAKCVVNYED